MINNWQKLISKRKKQALKQIKKHSDLIMSVSPVYLRKTALLAILLIFIFHTCLLNVSVTNAFFSDLEGAPENAKFTASSLDFSLTGDNFSPVVTPTQNSTGLINVIKDGALDFKYSIKTINLSGTLCSHLNLQADLNSYNGALSGFSYSTSTWSDPTTWNFTASLIDSNSSLQNQSCTFDFEFQASQLSNIGFSDTEIISNTIIAGTWQDLWVQTTEDDFDLGISSEYNHKKEIFTTTDGDAEIAVGLAIPPVAAASSGDGDSTHTAAQAIDGNMTTYWHGTTGKDSWLMVDLGDNFDVGGVKVWFGSNYAEDYRIQVSTTTDFGVYNTVYTKTGNHDTYINPTFTEIYGRYVRIYIDKVHGGNPKINEFLPIKPTLPAFDGAATLTSQVFDNGVINQWQKLEWDETLVGTSTDIAFRVATSNDGSTWTWYSFGSNNSPIDLGSIPQTRYIKWEATLITNPTLTPIPTPVLHEVRIYYNTGSAPSTIRLNEFLPNPEGLAYGFDFGTDSSSKPQGEWIELYNMDSVSADLAGWYIKDVVANKINITGSRTNTGSTIISGQGFLVVYLNSDILNNAGDSIYLYDSLNNLLDSHTYDNSNYCALEPTPADSNSGETPIGACTASVPGNKSFARIPDGTGAWIDPIPTPGFANVLAETIVEPNINSAPTTSEILFLTPEFNQTNSTPAAVNNENTNLTSETPLNFTPNINETLAEQNNSDQLSTQNTTTEEIIAPATENNNDNAEALTTENNTLETIENIENNNLDNNTQVLTPADVPAPEIVSEPAIENSAPAEPAASEPASETPTETPTI